MQLRLEPVTQGKTGWLCWACGQEQGQEGFVETVSACLDEAAQRADWRPMAIYDGTAVVGFAMYGYFFGNTRLRAACGWTGCSSTPPGRARLRQSRRGISAGPLGGGIRPAGYLSERSGRQHRCCAPV